MTKDEKKRLDIFNKISEDLINKGYTISERPMGMVKANILTITILGPLMYLILKLYGHLYSPDDLTHLLASPRALLLVGIEILALALVHELLHGLTWSFYTPNGFKDIAFGFMWKYLSPYCSCMVPLKRREYLLGILMPLFVLGIGPTIAGLVFGSGLVTLIGSIFIVGAGGDLIMAYLLMSYKTKGDELLVYDHPTTLAMRFFEKQGPVSGV